MPSDRRARNRNDRDGVPDRRRQGPDEEQVQQQEEKVEADKRQEQQRDAAQDAVGNQGIAAMLGLATVRPGEAGLAAGAHQVPEHAQELQLGGDAPPEDGPLTLDDLVRSWNPTTRRGQDAPGTLGTLDGLPEEDQALFDAIRADPEPLDLPPASGPDPLLQPSEELVTRDLGPAVRQAARWTSGSVAHRAWLGVVSPPARALVDPQGRLVHTRARVAALATLLLVDGLDGDEVSPVVGFTLELAARGGWVDRSLDRVREEQKRLPVAADLLRSLLGEARDGPASPGPGRPLPDGAAAQLAATLTDLLDLAPASTLLPSLVLPAEPEDGGDDPLGIDEVLIRALGASDPLAGVYDAALQGAERLAGAAARLRAHGAGMLAAVGDVCDQWSAGVPRASLLEVAEALDREVAEGLQLLVEVGRAIQRRAVAPDGIRNGLRRVARGLEGATSRLVARVIPVVGGVLPGSASGPVGPPPAAADDPLAEAWASGEPGAAVAWLGAQPAGLERDAAVLFTRAAAGEVEGLVSALWVTAGRAAARGRPALSGALGITAGAAMLRGGGYEAALTVAEAQLAAAEQRRNGVWVASAALLAMEAHRGLGDPARAEAVRYRAARVCWLVGSRAALSLLLRWRPPEDE